MKKLCILLAGLVMVMSLTACVRLNQQHPSGTDQSDQDSQNPGEDEGTAQEQPETPQTPQPEQPDQTITLVTTAETIEGWHYYVAQIQENGASVTGVCRSREQETQVLYRSDGAREILYAPRSYAESDDTGLYFTVSGDEGGSLWCFSLYREQFQQVLKEGCSNLVVFASNGGAQDGLGWILYDEYILPLNLRTQSLNMQEAASVQGLSGMGDVGASFFGTDGRSATLEADEYGVLKITVENSGGTFRYLYTCDTYHAQKIA